MKVGDFVEHVHAHKRENLIGVIIEEMHDPLAMNNRVFRVVWKDGSMGENVWDYDLIPLTARRA